MIAVVSCHHFPDDERIYHREIKTLLKHNFSIQYYTRSKNSIDLSKTGLIHVNSSQNFSISNYSQKVYKQLNKNRPPGIFHFHEPELFPLAKIVKENFNSKIIYDVHEDYPSLIQTFSQWRGIPGVFKKYFWLRNEKKFLSSIDKIILASPAIINSEYRKHGFSPTILENFPITNFIKIPDIKSTRGNTIIYHGHLGPERGIEELIRSIFIVVTYINNVSLLLFGSFRTEKFKAKIISLINELDLNNNVKWRGQIPHENIWSYLAKSSIGVIPFLDNKLTRIGTPTKLFEFMLSGCRIIASDLPPIRQYKVDGVIFSKPGDIKSLAKNILHGLSKKNIKDLENNQNRIIQKYNWEAIDQTLVNLYKKLLV